MTVEKHTTLLNYYIDKHILFKANDYSYIEIYDKEQIQLYQALEYYRQLLVQEITQEQNEKFYN